MKLYALTDGHEIFEVAAMTEEEYCLASEVALEATDGNIWWFLYN